MAGHDAVTSAQSNMPDVQKETRMWWNYLQAGHFDARLDTIAGKKVAKLVAMGISHPGDQVLDVEVSVPPGLLLLIGLL